MAETTALGAAYLAGLAVEYWHSLDDIAANWALDREFIPNMNDSERESRLKRWEQAVARAMHWEAPSP